MKKKDLNRTTGLRDRNWKSKNTGIYGHGASGKSTFAQELYQSLDAEKVNLLETDPYIYFRTTFGSA